MGHRLLRINERIKESVSAAIVERLKDPRVGFVTVTGVETSTDLRHAKVFVSVLGTAKERDATLEALRQARGVLQASITTGLRLKRTPQIEFVYDPTSVNAQRIESLIRREAAELEARGGAAGETGADDDGGAAGEGAETEAAGEAPRVDEAQTTPEALRVDDAQPADAGEETHDAGEDTHDAGEETPKGDEEAGS
ncbi:MAG TPA: 30S ribosome-binding factor RbfA [Thermoleophilia bacterium]|nr:30S ribosome-binding factor RbfA [Thermoleophilia bacterium]